MISNKPESTWSESHLTLELTVWFREHYPEIPYRVDIAADMPLPRIHRGRLKVLHGKWSRGHTDLIIYSGRGGYSALMVEIKTLKAGTPNTEHIRTQSNYHEAVKGQGFNAGFGVGFDDCTNQIENYMKKKLNKKGRNYGKK